MNLCWRCKTQEMQNPNFKYEGHSGILYAVGLQKSRTCEACWNEMNKELQTMEKEEVDAIVNALNNRIIALNKKIDGWLK